MVLLLLPSIFCINVTASVYIAILKSTALNETIICVGAGSYRLPAVISTLIFASLACIIVASLALFQCAQCIL